MSTIAVPVEIEICFGDASGSEPLSPRGELPMRQSGRTGHGASANLRHRGTGHHQWAGAARGTGAHGMSHEQLGSPGVFSHLREMRDSGMITNEQCVALATAAVGIRLGGGGEGSHVGSWRKGEAAEAGDLVSGTPVATFLDRSGNTGSTYAIGGNGGQPGAHLDHAAVFQKYLTDSAGHKTGMEVSEQYKGSGGAHERAYYFNNGWGEGNASNYHAIDVAGGGHLGGAANPLTQQEQYHKAAIKAATEATPADSPVVHNDHDIAAHEPGTQPAKKQKIPSKEMGTLLNTVDKYGDSKGNRYAHGEGEIQAPWKGYTLDKAEQPHPPPGKKPVPGIDIEPQEGLGREGKTGGFDIWGPGGRLPEPENKSGQRYPDKWKPGGTEI